MEAVIAQHFFYHGRPEVRYEPYLALIDLF